MSSLQITAISVAAVVVAILFFFFGLPGQTYEDHDVTDIERARLFAVAEKLLADSEAWEVEKQDGTVAVRSSLEPYPVRAVRYELEVDTDIERAIAYVKDETYSGPGRRELPGIDKWEETMFEKAENGRPVEWVRRSVHIAPPPGGNRDAVVMYLEDRPDPGTYTVAFQSVESMNGKAWPEVEDAVRFKVLPSIYKIEEIKPGRVRIRKVEGVDPRGAMSTAANNYFISFLFFRDFMFEQAKTMRDTLAAPAG